MATTVINPGSNNNSNNANGIMFLIGAVILLVVAYLFFFYALPYMRGFSGNGGVQVTVPKDINVKVQQSN